jgi:hypothetical protein
MGIGRDRVAPDKRGHRNRVSLLSHCGRQRGAMSDTATYWPLGVVHLIAPKDIVMFMGRIENKWKQGRIVLRGYKNETEFAPVDIIYSPNLELNWMGGPARERGIPGFPELEYYCE